MKKLLLSLAAVVCAWGSAIATPVTIDFSKQGYSNATDITTLTVDGVTVTFDKNTNSNGTKWYDSGSSLRMYASNTVTISVTGDNYLSEITFNTTAANPFLSDSKASVGDFNISDATWTSTSNDVKSVTITNGTGNSGQARFSIITVALNGESITPSETPKYNVAQAIDAIKGGYTGQAEITGIVSTVKSFNDTYGSITYYISDDGTTENQLQVYGGLGLNGAKFESLTSVQVGAKVVVKGNVKMYNDEPEVDMNSTLLSYVAPEGGETPSTPNPEGEITVAKALEYITSGNIPSGKVQVKGVISEITEINSQYGNATFIIKDALTDEAGLTVFRCKWLNGVNFTGNEIAVSGNIVVEGTLQNYDGTPEISTGGVVVSYDGPKGEEPDKPGTPTGDSVTFNFADITSLNPAYQVVEGTTEYDVTDVTFTAGVITLEGTAKEGASNKPRLFQASNTNQWTYRFYNDNTITIAVDDSDYVITGIVFVATNLNTSNIVFTNGTFSDNIFTPESNSGVENMTISKTATGNNPTITSATVYYTTKAGIEGVVAEDSNAPVEYFNLQGVRVANPENGLFIRRQGNTVTKVLVK